MPRILITGGPGAGKTALLTELAARGYTVLGDSAREVISSRRAQGLSPRPEPKDFALEILRRDIRNYEAVEPAAGLCFCERGVVDALGMMLESGALPPHEVAALLARYPYDRTAFVLPPWEAIYTRDSERDQSFAEAVVVHGMILRWYKQCGYALQELPRTTVQARAEHVLHVTAASAA